MISNMHIDFLFRHSIRFSTTAPLEALCVFELKHSCLGQRSPMPLRDWEDEPRARIPERTVTIRHSYRPWTALPWCASRSSRYWNPTRTHLESLLASPGLPGEVSTTRHRCGSAGSLVGGLACPTNRGLLAASATHANRLIVAIPRSWRIATVSSQVAVISLINPALARPECSPHSF